MNIFSHLLCEGSFLHVTEKYNAVSEDRRVGVRCNPKIIDKLGRERHQHRDVSPQFVLVFGRLRWWSVEMPTLFCKYFVSLYELHTGGTRPHKYFLITYLFFLFLITSRRQGSSFPARFDLLRFHVPLHAEVQPTVRNIVRLVLTSVKEAE